MNRELEPLSLMRINGNKLVVNVDCRSESYCVVTDTFFPGWKATVNGQAVPIYRANYLFRAVRVPQGKSQVVFVYEPDSYKLGLMLFCISSSVMTIICVLAFIRRRRRLARVSERD